MPYQCPIPANERRGPGQTEEHNFAPAVVGDDAFAPRTLPKDDSAGFEDNDQSQGVEHSFFSQSRETGSPVSYWSLKTASRKSLRVVLLDIALVLLFSAGLMRTAIPSLIYAVISIQALYSRNRGGLKTVLPKIWVVLVACVALAMIVSHAILNLISASGFSPILLQVAFKCPFSCSYSITLADIWLLYCFAHVNWPHIRVILT